MRLGFQSKGGMFISFLGFWYHILGFPQEQRIRVFTATRDSVTTFGVSTVSYGCVQRGNCGLQWKKWSFLSEEKRFRQRHFLSYICLLLLWGLQSQSYNIVMGAPKHKWSQEEESALRSAVAKHGPGRWRTILKDPDFSQVLFLRSNVDLKVISSLLLHPFSQLYSDSALFCFCWTETG